MNVLAIDQGTSATKAIVVADGGRVLGEGTAPVHPKAGPGGAVEQDPEELLDSIVAAGRAALEAAGEPVDAVGVGNQCETVLRWDRRPRPRGGLRHRGAGRLLGPRTSAAARAPARRRRPVALGASHAGAGRPPPSARRALPGRRRDRARRRHVRPPRGRRRARPRGRFLVRADAFPILPDVEVAQDRRTLWRGLLRRLQPGRSRALPAGWLPAVDAGGGPVAVRVRRARVASGGHV